MTDPKTNPETATETDDTIELTAEEAEAEEAYLRRWGSHTTGSFNIHDESLDILPADEAASEAADMMDPAAQTAADREGAGMDCGHNCACGFCGECKECERCSCW